MKIGIVCNSFKNDGGMETYTLQLVEALLPYLESKPVILTKKIDPEQKLLNNVSSIKINVAWLPRILKDLYFSWKVKKLKKQLGIDILIGCCRCSASDIVMCGGTHKGFVLSKGRRTLYDRVIEKIETSQNNSAKFIVAHSKLMKDELIRLYGVPSGKISVLYPPVSYAKFHPVSKDEKEKLRKKLGLSSEKLYFLFVSSSHKRKGLDLLAQYFSETNLPVTLLVVGKKVDRSIKNVEYFGYSNNIEELYQAVDFSILASNYEPFGLAAVESVASGTPIVASNKLGSNEIIENNFKYVFEAGSIESLRTQIELAIKNSSPLTKGRDNKTKFNYDLSVHYHVSKVLEIINSIHSKKGQNQDTELPHREVK